MMNAGQVARIAHEVNRAYCQAIGDYSQPSWEDAPDWQKQSAINGVLFNWVNDAVTPELSHASWMLQKLSDGWKYGPIKDPEKKEHPCIVPYEQLPEEQRIKDHLFIAVCNAANGDEE